MVATMDETHFKESHIDTPNPRNHPTPLQGSETENHETEDMPTTTTHVAVLDKSQGGLEPDC